MTTLAELDPADLRELRRRLYRYARFRLPSDEVAEDVVQDALESMLCEASPFEGRSQYRVWAIAIVRHKIADYYRHPSRREQAHGAAQAPWAHEGGVDAPGEDTLAPWLRETGTSLLDQPEKCCEMTELCERVEAALARQPRQQARAFVLRAVHELPTTEIADRLGLQKGHCDVLVLRARRALAQDLGHLAGPGSSAGHPARRTPRAAAAPLRTASA